MLYANSYIFLLYPIFRSPSPYNISVLSEFYTDASLLKSMEPDFPALTEKLQENNLKNVIYTGTYPGICGILIW